MRTDSGFRGESRSSALWGRRGESRSSALWGRGGRGALTVFALALVFVVPMVGSAASGPGKLGGAYVPKSLLAAATANPTQVFHVIVQGQNGNSSADVSKEVAGNSGQVKRKFFSVAGVSADLRGAQLVALTRNSHIGSITPDVRTQQASYEDAEMWRDTTDVTALYAGDDGTAATAPQAPAIAIVDSGVDASKAADFGARVVANVNLSSLDPGTLADGEGHGTMVADVAAGSNPDHMGAAPNAPIVALKTADANGQSLTSDVIAACDWILQNKDRYNIRVANFSMAGSTDTSFRYDPLDRAVERLWFAGVVVVAAAGNHGNGGPVDMSYAPGNDPFVITVGATDQHSNSDPSDDTTPSWSAFGQSVDGFEKPDLSAPGRYMIAAVPAGSTIPATVPDRVTAPGYVWMSGTSFAAPVVSGAAAQILARHPDWGPNEVKGALMLTSAYLPNATDGVGNGVGEVDAAAAASLDFTPPNPNENLMPFVHTDSATGAPSFDQASWAATVASDASWSQASWAAAAWASASWSQAAWTSASWSQAAWSSDVTGQMTSLASWSESTFQP